MNACLHLGLAQLQVQLERLIQGPAMLEAVIAAGGHDGREGRRLGEGRDGWRHVLELGGAGANDPGTAWTEHPFMRAGDEEVAMHVRKIEVFDTETMHAVDHVKNAIFVVAVAVQLFHQLADFADGQFHAAARLHPGHAQHTGIRSNALGNRRQHFVLRNVATAFEQLELADLHPVLLLAVIQRVIGRVVLVFGGEDFLVRAHMDAAVDQRQTLGGAAGEGDLFRGGLEVTSSPRANFLFAFLGFPQVPVHGSAGVAVEVGAVPVDGFAHGPRVRRHQEVGEVQVVRILIEQLTQLRPFVLRQRRWIGGQCRQVHSGTQGQARGKEAGLLEE